MKRLQPRRPPRAANPDAYIEPRLIAEALRRTHFTDSNSPPAFSNYIFLRNKAYLLVRLVALLRPQDATSIRLHSIKETITANGLHAVLFQYMAKGTLRAGRECDYNFVEYLKSEPFDLCPATALLQLQRKVLEMFPPQPGEDPNRPLFVLFNGKPMSPSTGSSFIKKMLTDLGRPDAMARDLRHCSAIRLQAMGVPGELINQRGNWVSGANTRDKHYSNRTGAYNFAQLILVP